MRSNDGVQGLASHSQFQVTGKPKLGGFSGLRCHVLAFFVALLLVPTFAHGGNNYTVLTESSSGLKIEVKSWFSNAPPSGVIPVRVRITNASEQDYSFKLASRDQAYGFGTYSAQSPVASNAGSTSESEVYLSLLTNPDDAGKSSYYKNVNLTLNGSGVIRPQVGTISQNHSGSNASRTALIGFDSALSFNAVGSFISNKDLLTESLSMADAPREWRGYTALAQLWVTGRNLAAMSGEQRAAMLDWVTTGGRLFVKTETPASVAGSLQLPPFVGDVLPHGFGSIHILGDSPNQANNGTATNQQSFAQRAAKLINLTDEQTQPNLLKSYYAASWQLRKLAGELVMNGKLIFGFILIFGIIVGPVNLFVFAPSVRRQCLFWTTPLISLIGSGVLVAIMLLQDGVGGTGARLTLGIIEPHTKRLAIVQEQASRTGILLSRSIANTEPVWMLPLPKERGTSMGYRSNDGENEYSETAEQFAGSWFSSRATQAQALITVRPSREALELTPGKTPNDAPSIISSIGNGLKSLYVMDGAKQLWKAENVGTGERVNLKKTTQVEFKKWQQENIVEKSSKLFDARVESITSNDAHWFIAEVEQPEKLAIPTLSSIRWTNDHAFIGGMLKP